MLYQYILVSADTQVQESVSGTTFFNRTSLNNMVQKTMGMAQSGPALSSTHAGIIQGSVSLHHLALSVDQELNPRRDGQNEGRGVRMWIHTPLELSPV